MTSTVAGRGYRAVSGLRKAWNNNPAAFTLVELLVVVAVVAILAVLSLDGISAGLRAAKGSRCIGNLRQMQLAYQQYVDENLGRLPSNDAGLYSGVWRSVSNSWCGWSNARVDTNSDEIRKGVLFTYVGDPLVFRCPSDSAKTDSKVKVARGRSFSLHGVLSGRHNGIQSIITNISESVAPANLVAFIDESDATIDDGHFLIYPPPATTMTNRPAARHSKGTSFSLLDGHVVIERFADPVSELQKMSLPVPR